MIAPVMGGADEGAGGEDRHALDNAAVQAVDVVAIGAAGDVLDTAAGRIEAHGLGDGGAGKAMAEALAAIDAFADDQMRQQARRLGGVDLAPRRHAARRPFHAPIGVDVAQQGIIEMGFERHPTPRLSLMLVREGLMIESSVA